MSRNPNPYKGLNFTQIRPIWGCTHMHCIYNDQFQSYTQQGLEFVTVSNYHPSTPWYPLRSMRTNTMRIGQKGIFRNGIYNPGYVDLTPFTGESRDEGEPIFSPIPEALLEAPNAEHHWFSDYGVHLHITAPGSAMSSGYMDIPYAGLVPPKGLAEAGFQRGFPKDWRTAFGMILDNLIVPDGGGIIINHPTWSHLPLAFLLDMLDYDDRVLGIEVFNAGCQSDFTESSDDLWDAILATGRQCYGFCVQDHPGDVWQGRIAILSEERTVPALLRALRQGQFYGAVTGQHHFTNLSFDGETLHVSCDEKAEIQIISKVGVADFTDGMDFTFHVSEQDYQKHGFLRVTARFGRRNDKLFSQAFMLK